MDKRVLIIGPNFFYFNDSIANAFRENGWTPKVCAFDTPVHPYDRKNKFLYKLSSDKERMKKLGRMRFSQEAKAMFDDFKPSLLFVVNSDGLLLDMVAYFKCTAKVVLWCFDSVERFPAMKECMPYADRVFCYEQTDIEVIKREMNIEALFLPQAVDLARYYKMEGTEKIYDVVFAGDIWLSKKRQRILSRVVEAFPEKRILVWGVYKPWFKHPWKWLTRERRDIYMNCNTDSVTLNRCYNQARVVLNIHNEQQVDGANPKVYEISAAGSYQVCDGNPFVKSLFPQGELGLYYSDDECLDLIRRALAEDCSSRAEAARQKVVSEHTFTHRIAYVLSQL